MGKSAQLGLPRLHLRFVMSTKLRHLQHRHHHRRPTPQIGSPHSGHANPPGRAPASHVRAAKRKGYHHRWPWIRRSAGRHCLLCGGVDRKVSSPLEGITQQKLATTKNPLPLLLLLPLAASFAALESIASAQPVGDSTEFSKPSALFLKFPPWATQTGPHLSSLWPDLHPYLRSEISTAAPLARQ